MFILTIMETKAKDGEQLSLLSLFDAPDKPLKEVKISQPELVAYMSVSGNDMASLIKSYGLDIDHVFMTMAHIQEAIEPIIQEPDISPISPLLCDDDTSYSNEAIQASQGHTEAIQGQSSNDDDTSLLAKWQDIISA